MNYYLYIVECSDGSLYTGWTKDLKKRLKSHNEGKGAKYTRSRIPVSLKFSKELSSKSLALKMEHRVKKLSRQQKLEIINKQDISF